MKRGFSLVELSIVLVILGLLVGGVLAGKSLIHAAELRSVSRDFQKYHAAVMSFRDKYFYLPGDMPNASSFWGAADGDDGLDIAGAACTSVVSTDATTCNGDGDGQIGSTINETYRAWQHLADAGLMEGQYTGYYDMVGGFGPTYLTRGTNIPASKMSNGAFRIGLGMGQMGFLFGPAGTATTEFSGNHIDLIRPPITTTAGQGSTPFLGVVTHEDAWNLDTKMDDGVANTGKVRADFVKRQGAKIAITDMTCQTYDLANSTNYCALAYTFGN